jgi:phytanoyl-CoA hydroxylase
MTTPTYDPTRRTTAETLSDEKIASYRQNGFVHIPGILAPEEAATFYDAAVDAMARLPKHSSRSIFDQYVNVWTQDEGMKCLTFHPNVAKVAERLAGVPLRFWHDQILTKAPHNNAATEYHQDQPYWPHGDATNPISAWIALCDVPVEKGCMTFIPGSQKRTDLPPQNLGDAKSLMELAPDFVWSQRITVPLRAGDCTFHHGRCAHMATPNFTDDPRVAHVVIFTDASTTYTGKRHVVTDPLGLEVGSPLEGEFFPRVADYAR